MTNNELNQLVTKLLQKPKTQFFGYLCAGITKQMVSKDVKTACVHSTKNGEYKLMFNSDFMDALSFEEQVFVVCHELLHIVYFTFEFNNTLTDHKLLNIASDMAINTQLVRAGFTMPEKAKGVLPTDYPEIFASDDNCKTTHFYYYKIKEYLDNNPELKGQGGGKSYMDVEKGSNDIFGADSDTELEMDKLTEVAQEVIKQQLQELVEMAQKTAGNSTFDISGNLDKVFLPPVISWKALLRKFVSSAVSVNSKSTKSRSNRRYGLDRPGYKPTYRLKVIIGVDSSGSMSDKDLREAVSEMLHISKEAEISYVPWDDTVGELTKFNKSSEVNRVKAGGTNASCFINFVNKLSNTNRPDFVIIYTDGYIESNPIKCNYPTLWLITEDGSDDFEHKGKKIKIKH